MTRICSLEAYTAGLATGPILLIAAVLLFFALSWLIHAPEAAEET